MEIETHVYIYMYTLPTNSTKVISERSCNVITLVESLGVTLEMIGKTTQINSKLALFYMLKITMQRLKLINRKLNLTYCMSRSQSPSIFFSFNFFSSMPFGSQSLHYFSIPLFWSSNRIGHCRAPTLSLRAGARQSNINSFTPMHPLCTEHFEVIKIKFRSKELELELNCEINLQWTIEKLGLHRINIFRA